MINPSQNRLGKASKEGKEQVKVMVVDDDEDLREILSAILHDEGYTVVSARDAREAIANVKEDGFSLIFMDIVLPGMNGVDVYKAIKKMSPATATVMITGHSVENLVKEAINEGAYGCLYKPFGMDEVLNAVRETIGSN